jgi:hypothetical protein
MSRAWIQTPPGRWGETAALKGGLHRLGYHVEELRGTGPVWLWITGSPVRGVIPVPPLSDPRAREPRLEPAAPKDAIPGSSLDVNAAVEIQLGDGSWVRATVVIQRRDANGKWCVHLRWIASTVIGGREGAFVYDPEYIRKLPGEALEAQRGGERPQACSPLILGGAASTHQGGWLRTVPADSTPQLPALLACCAGCRVPLKYSRNIHGAPLGARRPDPVALLTPCGAGRGPALT